MAPQVDAHVVSKDDGFFCGGWLARWVQVDKNKVFYANKEIRNGDAGKGGNQTCMTKDIP